MKSVKIIFFILLAVVVIAGAAVFIFVKTFDINKHNARITQEISSLLGRQARLGRMELGFSVDKGVNIVVQDISIADDPRFSTEPLLAADLVYLNVDVLAFLLRKEVLVPRIDLRNPRLNLVRDNEGKINIQELIASWNVSKTAAAPESMPSLWGPAFAFAQEKETSQGKTDPSSMLIRSVRIQNGSVFFTDRGFEPPLHIPLERIEFQTVDISLNAPFKFRIDCSLWSVGQNIHADGTARIDAASQQMRFEQVRLETDVSQLILKETPIYVLIREAMKVEDALEGKLIVDVPRAVLGAEGIAALSLNGGFTGGRLKFDGPGSPLEDINLNLEMTESRLDIKDASLSCALGKVRLGGRLEDYLKEQKYFFDLKVEDVQLSALVPRESMPVVGEATEPIAPQGRIYADFGAQGQGFDAASLKTRLKGEGMFELKDGRIKNVNLLRFVLNKISFIPDLVSRIEQSLPPQYQEKLTREETVLEQAQAALRLEKGVLLFDNAALNADGFMLSAQGSVDLEQNLALQASFDIAPALASSMTAAVEELSYLSDERGQIHIPFKPYEGKLAKFRLYPDIEDLGKKTLQNKGKEELRRVILDAIGVEDEKPAPGQGTEGIPPEEGQPQQEKRPEEILIDGVLDAIFKGGQTF